MIKRKDFFHRKIKYSFNWNFQNHQRTYSEYQNNRKQFKKLEMYFKKVHKGAIPNQIFNARNMPRISQFRIKGLKRGFLPSFSRELINSGKVKKFGSDHKLSKYAANVYQIYKKNKINKKPGHDPVLKHILIKDKCAIAIEVPIWKKFNNEFLTGHIDLVQIEQAAFKIVDYKPEGHFLKSLPQVSMYGILFQSVFKVDNLKCISFNKDKAWEYDPNILLTDIRNFLKNQGIAQAWQQYVP
ncbi:MAG: hypothetical protein R6U96_11820 [Promethearchaeia archaeon]